MPIAVHCPSCQALFHVGDEFAGRPGRCPECGTVLRVPGPEPEPEPLPEPHPEHPDPYRTPRPVEPPDDDRPFPSRRRRDNYRDDEDRVREDFDDQFRPARRGFDPHTRAAAWERVIRGLWYVLVAAVLYAFAEVFVTGFMIARGIKENAPVVMDSGLVAAFCGYMVVLLAGVGFWLLGRFLCVRVPYVPARGWAKASFGLGLTGMFLVVTCFCLIVMAAGAAGGGQGNAPAVGVLFLMSLMALGVAFLAVLGAEGAGLMSLIQIGKGLRDNAAAGWAKLCLGLMIFLLGAGTVAVCGITIYAMDKQQKKLAAQGAAKANNPPANDKKADDKGKADPKAEGKDKAKDAPPQVNPPANPPPNPFEPEQPFDDTTQLIVNLISLGVRGLYLIVYITTLAKVRGAIRREIKVLTGEADREPWETDQHRY
jgi:hypothetical protein